MTAAIRARIGMVNFINTAPLYEVWKERVRRPDWRIVEDNPARLNRMLYNGELDLGFVSSHEYAVHPEKYRILSDLSISASGPVGSVFLFADIPPERLSGELIMLSAQSQTSNFLIKIIMEEFYQVRPRYCLPAAAAADEQGRATLAIGDRALRLREEGRYPYVLDLSDIWMRHTGLPFVFAVWAVREEFCRSDMDVVTEIHYQLLRCVAQGRKELDRISAVVAERIPMAVDDCLAYLKRIEYDLGSSKKKALEVFNQFLINRGEADPASLPLKICG